MLRFVYVVPVPPRTVLGVPGAVQGSVINVVQAEPLLVAIRPSVYGRNARINGKRVKTYTLTQIPTYVLNIEYLSKNKKLKYI